MDQDWKQLPGDTGDEHVFCIGDVHGELASLDAALGRISDLPKHGPTRLIFLGDLIDRGPAPLECVQRAWQAADHTGVDEVIVLPGNHELMLLGSLGGAPDEMSQSINEGIWLANGGMSAIKELEANGCDMSSREVILEELQKALPEDFNEVMLSRSHVTQGDMVFVHAGVHPHIDMDTFLAEDPFAHDNWAWIRGDFLHHEGGWDAERRRVIVHGHTPWEQDVGSAMKGAFSERNRAWRAGETMRIDSHFETAEGADMVESHRRINLDSGCGKATTTLPFAEFFDGNVRLHVVTPQEKG
ncbi:metallophosphoesterase [Salipiger mucosus]|uniref:Serine/threonine protein phosphatase n=1 Tax=Salipiger mucosus DSM 16094 TaxID=1123237 RepID=S9RS35_9RHOB|nr:metallophosphoesterase [Salipiger mucosus]EPX76789.1 serine/threonine protein phosphatase [Salipiger mucosus DSM 16094]